jgi:hypothetical protein
MITRQAMIDTEDPFAALADRPPVDRRKAGFLARTASGLAGAILLIAGTLFTVGVVTLASLSVLVARLVQRRRGRWLTTLHSWMTAGVTATVVIVIAVPLIMASLPEGVIADAMADAEATAEAPGPEPPEWLRRFTPPSEPSPMTERIVNSRAFNLYFGVIGASMAVALIGGVIGSWGWVATLLLGHAARGYWPFRADGTGA